MDPQPTGVAIVTLDSEGRCPLFSFGLSDFINVKPKDFCFRAAHWACRYTKAYIAKICEGHVKHFPGCKEVQFSVVVENQVKGKKNTMMQTVVMTAIVAAIGSVAVDSGLRITLDPAPICVTPREWQATSHIQSTGDNKKNKRVVEEQVAKRNPEIYNRFKEYQVEQKLDRIHDLCDAYFIAGYIPTRDLNKKKPKVKKRPQKKKVDGMKQ